MESVSSQPDTTSCRVGRGESLAVLRYKIDALAYAESVGGLLPKGRIEYRRLCDRQRALLAAGYVSFP